MSGLLLTLALAFSPPGEGGDAGVASDLEAEGPPPGAESAPPPPSSTPAGEQRPLAEAIDVDAGATCLDPDQLRAQVAEFRGDPTVDARLHVRVIGGERPDLVRFEVVWQRKTIVVRDFDPAPKVCEDLHAVVGVALAIAIDDESLAEAIARADEPQPAPRPEPQPEPPPEPEPQPEPELEPVGAVTGRVRPAERSPTRLSLGLDGLLLVGVIPQVAGGASVGIEVGPVDWLDVRIAGHASFAIDREFAGGLLDFGLGGASVDLCAGGPAGWRVRPRGCVGFLASAVRWVGRGYDVSEAGVAPWLAATAGGDLRIALAPRFGLQLSARLGIPVLKSDYALLTADGQRTLAAPPVGALVGFGPIFGVL